MKLKLSQLHTYNNKIGPESPNKGGGRLTLEGQSQCIPNKGEECPTNLLDGL